VGGLKEKILAAFRAGIREVLLPEENAKDLEEIPKEVSEAMTFVQVASMDEVLERALICTVNPNLVPASGESQGALSPPMSH